MLTNRRKVQTSILAVALRACQESPPRDQYCGQVETRVLCHRHHVLVIRFRCAKQMILDTPNGPLYYETHGSGPPIVFLSGWAMTCECWRLVTSILARRYTCFLYDASGTGRSQPATL